MDDASIRLRVLQAEDEKSYKDAMTAFAAFASTLSTPTSTSTVLDESTYRLDQALANAEVSLAQWQQTQQTFAGESVLHTGAIEETKSKSKQVQVEIEQAKVALVNAKVVRGRKEEYRRVLHQIEQYQSRDQSVAELSAMDKEIGGLRRELDDAKSELDLKRRQLALLLHALTLTVETEANDPTNAPSAEPESSMT